MAMVMGISYDKASFLGDRLVDFLPLVWHHREQRLLSYWRAIFDEVAFKAVQGSILFRENCEMTGGVGTGSDRKRFVSTPHHVAAIPISCQSPLLW